jgi:hypothetical protein
MRAPAAINSCFLRQLPNNVLRGIGGSILVLKKFGAVFAASVQQFLHSQGASARIVLAVWKPEC